MGGGLPRPAARLRPSLQVRRGVDSRLQARTDRDVELESLASVQSRSRDKHVIQWYPGHIARGERLLREQINRVDLVLEVRDARIINSTKHPNLATWSSHKPRFLVINRADMVSRDDMREWKRKLKQDGVRAFFTNGKNGQGVRSLITASQQLGAEVNEARLRRGIKTRPLRACVVGFPNIGKSALINRLLNRRVVDSAAKPGVTRTLRWVRMGKHLDLLDAPGILPGAIDDQNAATRLAICNDISEAAYVPSIVAARFVDWVRQLSRAGIIRENIRLRYGLDCLRGSGEDFVIDLADTLFIGDAERAAQRILKDYRDCKLGKFALEEPYV